MLAYPYRTSREEKWEFIDQIKDRLLAKHGDMINAIGVYGSIGQQKDGPYSDIELHVVTKDGTSFAELEIVYPPFKLEIGVTERTKWLAKSRRVDDSWAIWYGAFIHIISLYDPEGLFDTAKKTALSLSDEQINEVMREFMIWEPYETMGKIRNSYNNGDLTYLSRAAYDITWQTAKLIGLANKRYYSTRAATYIESLLMPSVPSGYQALVMKVIEGDLRNKEEIYLLCEGLWTGLNEWYSKLGIDYVSKELPV